MKLTNLDTTMSLMGLTVLVRYRYTVTEYVLMYFKEVVYHIKISVTNGYKLQGLLIRNNPNWCKKVLQLGKQMPH